MQKEVAAHTNVGSLSPPNQLQHTKFNHPICKGTFGEIWQGTLNSKVVAIKKFHSSQKSSWEHEKEIYSLGLEHPGILKVKYVRCMHATPTLLFTIYCRQNMKSVQVKYRTDVCLSTPLRRA